MPTISVQIMPRLTGEPLAFLLRGSNHIQLRLGLFVAILER